jgi:general secretion pathway protein A
MYNAFFHLTRSPFEISPDPAFFYAAAQHEEALAGLYYGIRAGKGFMVLTGEVGTGKTLVVRCLQELLNKNRVVFAYVFNPRLSSNGFLSYIAGELGLSPHPTQKSDLLIGLSRLLIERRRHGVMTVLVVEEAQHLSPVVLEEIRLLTNLETPLGKLIQILLVGQPEFAKTLDSPTLRQLKQRVSLWFRLDVLSQEETSNYVHCRLKRAGDQNGNVFATATIERIHHYSQGIPRLINTLCDNAMMSAFAGRQEQVTPELIEEAASDLGLKRVNGNGRSSVSAPWRRDEESDGEAGSFGPVMEAKTSNVKIHAYPKSFSSAKEERQ